MTDKKDPGLLLEDVNRFLKHVGAKRTAEVLVGLIGVVGLTVLAIEARKPHAS